MERVQFQQEQMLTELKDLVRKGLFTQKETKQIMQKRTAFETALVRRIPKKGDFLRYIAYEMGLEALRRKRAARLLDGPQPPSVSDYALVRRQFHIFERALKKFKGDVALWIQYIQVAKKEGARTLVGRITARALQLHPSVPALYILAASHELEQLAPSAARALLQRGIRLNPESTEMWREYVKMELGFVESLRRRWGVLGIELQENKRKGKEKAREIDENREMDDNEVEQMQVDAEDGGDEGEAARRQIMQGAIVKSVMSSAVKALPRIDLFTSLQDLLTTYPCPTSLRDALLDHLFTLLHETLPDDPAAIRLSATRHLLPDLEGEALVDALKDANEQLAGAVRHQNAVDERLASVYATFVKDWCQKNIDDSLKGYLITSLQLLAHKKSANPSPSLLAATITLLTTHQESLADYLPPTSNTPERVLRLARKATGKESTRHSAPLWLARLDAEKQLSANDDAKRAWDEARAAVVGAGTETVWLWGLGPEPDWEAATIESGTGTAETGVVEHIQLLERLLGEGHLMRDATAWPTVQETLLMRYTRATDVELKIRFRPETSGECAAPPAGTRKRKRTRGDTDGEARSPSMAYVDARAARVRHIASAYLVTAAVWREVFAQEEAASEEAPACSGHIIELVYEQWRRKDGVRATVGWARWLLAHGKAKAATEVVMRTRSSLPEDEARELEHLWKKEVDAIVEAPSSDVPEETSAPAE